MCAHGVDGRCLLFMARKVSVITIVLQFLLERGFGFKFTVTLQVSVIPAVRSGSKMIVFLFCCEMAEAWLRLRKGGL